MLELETTAGAEDANSYATLAEASTYFEAVLWFSTTWERYATPTKIARLVSAARAIDRLPLQGSKATSDQALQFPRAFGGVQVPGQVGMSLELPEDEIPKEVKDAQCEMVLLQYRELDASTGAAPREIAKVSVPDVVSVEYVAGSTTNATASQGTMESVRALLSYWVGSGNNFYVTK